MFGEECSLNISAPKILRGRFFAEEYSLEISLKNVRCRLKILANFAKYAKFAQF